MRITIFFLFLCAFSNLNAQTDPHAWSRVDKPTSGRLVQSIGKYTSGCLRGAVNLPHNGKGYQVMRLSRKRYYGHPDLVRFIENMGQITYNQRLGTLLIGDLGLARGGPTLTGHRSHQTGLDVDIWYLLAPEAQKRELSVNERETWGAPSVLTAKSDGVNPVQWTLANEQILEAAARLPAVDRIFVNAHVKRALCNRKSNRDWLQKIRPWYAHDDHFHVRLKCPASDIYCEKQEPVPLGDGCGADLAWWFSPEALMPSKKPPAKKIPLPKECDLVINEN
jgi:penicillin-insensitive murein DD-endopeptidase